MIFFCDLLLSVPRLSPLSRRCLCFVMGGAGGSDYLPARVSVGFSLCYVTL